MALKYDSYTDARNHLKDLLNAADDGRATVVCRDQQTATVVDAARLQHTLSTLTRGQVQVVAEPEGQWTLLLPGIPVATQAPDFDVAVADFIEGLRDYAADWQDRLRLTSNHAQNWGLVQLIELSDNSQLQDWILGKQP